MTLWSSMPVAWIWILWEQVKALRWDSAFPKCANINMYTRLDENTVRVLTFERGVEDYALACGTSCGSTACILWAQGKLLDGRLTCHNKGGSLTVTLEGSKGCITSLLLEGPAVVVQKYSI